MDVEESTATGWVAWVLFGGIALVLLGTVHLCMGSLALFGPEMLAGTRSGQLLSISLTALGWVHMVVGALAVVTGAALFTGRARARGIAVALTAVLAVVNFLFLGERPVFSGIAIVLAVVVLWAVAVHGSEVADAQGK